MHTCTHVFATTALVALAGFASAQGVEISGSAEMGYGSTNPDHDGEVNNLTEGFMQSVDVRFRMSGETDNGLSFGAQIDLEDAAQMGTTTETVDAGADYTVFVSGAFGNLTMGDTDGALDFVMQEADTAMNAGSLNDSETAHAGFVGAYGDGAGTSQILRYDNTFGDFRIAASVERGGSTAQDAGYALGVGYTLGFAGGSVQFGAGYQNIGEGNSAEFTNGTAYGAGDVDIWGVSAALAMDNGFEATVAYSTFDGSVYDVDNISVGIGYEFGPFTVSANYGANDANTGLDTEGYGLAAAYDLGGGAELQAGYGSGNRGEDAYSFGLAMSF